MSKEVILFYTFLKGDGSVDMDNLKRISENDIVKNALVLDLEPGMHPRLMFIDAVKEYVYNREEEAKDGPKEKKHDKDKTTEQGKLHGLGKKERFAEQRRQRRLKGY